MKKIFSLNRSMHESMEKLREEVMERLRKEIGKPQEEKKYVREGKVLYPKKFRRKRKSLKL